MELDLEVHQAKADKEKLKLDYETCAQFQKEILWCNIDVAEGKKQCLAMSQQLSGTKQLYDESQRENAELKARIESMAHENRILQKHKKLLVSEVKSLQKYSHVNITGLEQDAHEARMMQKSLSAQLDRLDTEFSPL
ncbi:hypothetical protein DYB32_002945 [Aphanomyces invadans]|uniref:Uncharacterized protein n=1 Tax=Aphanomyces invadans TaxID=157072 RepID=A0A418B1W0_9STRA|nr:hypothetical protein DYB32_002945 [Aphanomyces invadans]